METTIILCFITYIGFEMIRFASDRPAMILGYVLFFVGLCGLVGRLLGNLL